jgi:hypothetical protein
VHDISIGEAGLIIGVGISHAQAGAIDDMAVGRGWVGAVRGLKNEPASLTAPADLRATAAATVGQNMQLKARD